MADLEREFLKLTGVEEHILNAASAIRLAKERLGSSGRLHKDMAMADRALTEAADHVQTAKRALVAQWREVAARGSAA
jgi:hypothetical protein